MQTLTMNLETLTVPDHAVWLACFTAAIGGTLAAQRRLPNPELIVRWCETFADRALVAARKRRTTNEGTL